MASSQDFTMGAVATNDIAISSDTHASSDTKLVTAGYVNTVSGAISGGSPGGSDTEIQFNEGGSSFGGISSFIWNDTDLKIDSDTTKLWWGDDADLLYGIMVSTLI